MDIWVCQKPTFQSKIKITNKKNLATMTPVTILGMLKDIIFGGGRLSTRKWRKNSENAPESRMKYSLDLCLRVVV